MSRIAEAPTSPSAPAATALIGMVMELAPAGHHSVAEPMLTNATPGRGHRRSSATPGQGASAVSLATL